MSRRKSQPDDEPLPPLPFASRSNAERFVAPAPFDLHARHLAMQVADRAARRVGMTRRELLRSVLGTAASLAVLNRLTGCAAAESGEGLRPDASGFDLPDGSLHDAGVACSVLAGDEFVFDAQTHHVDAAGGWRDTNPTLVSYLESFPGTDCGLTDALTCLGSRRYLEGIFLESDTSVALLSGIPASACRPGSSRSCGNPLDAASALATEELVNALGSSRRLVRHGLLMPDDDLPRALADMDTLAASGVVGWKCYPQWGATGRGWALDDEAIGVPMLERAVSLGAKVVAVHKGLPLPGDDVTHAGPADVCRAAKRFPELTFVVYHSSYRYTPRGMLARPEGPYDPVGDPEGARRGINALLSAMDDEGLAPNANVYAELGSVWSDLAARPTEAAHVLGKLLNRVGEHNVLWGTDCVWYGSPQPQLEAFRSFRIGEALREKWGYPELTDAVRRRVLGLNAARVFGVDPEAVRCEIEQSELGLLRRELDNRFGPRRWASRRLDGPGSVQEHRALLRLSQGRPA